jgi:hypothetical protein
MKLCVQRDWRHALNVAIYLALVTHELRQAKHHWTKAC